MDSTQGNSSDSEPDVAKVPVQRANINAETPPENRPPVISPKRRQVHLDHADRPLTGLRSPADAPPIPTLVPQSDVPTAEHPIVSKLDSLDVVVTGPCHNCRATGARAQYSIAGIPERMIVCVGCGLGSLHPLPGHDRVAEFYPAKFEFLVELGVRVGAWARIQSLRFQLPRGARVLDIGCGRGTTLRALLDLGYEAHGVELCEDATAGVDPRAVIRIAPDLVEAGYEENSFDAVVIWHVLEHVTAPDRTLAEVQRILRPGGRLVLAVPNLGSWQAQWTGESWFHLDLPRHLYHFSPESLSGMLSRHGFNSVKIRHFALLQNPFGWLQSVLNMATRCPRNSLYSLLHRGGQHPDVKTMTRRQRMGLRLAYLLGLPIALGLSVVESLARRGGTMAVTAKCK